MRISGLMILTGLAAAAPTVAQDVALPKNLQREAALFGMREGVSSANLSPDGKNVVFIAASKGRQSIAMVVPTAGGKPQQIGISDGAPFRLTWCDWANNTRLICQLYAVTDRNQRNINMPFTRMMAFDITGGKAVDLTPQSKVGFLADITSGGEVLSWLNEDTALMERYHMPERESVTRGAGAMHYGLAVDRVNLGTGKAANVVYPDNKAISYLADANGVVRFKGQFLDAKKGESEVYSVQWLTRPTANADWTVFSNDNDGEDFTPLAITADGQHVYAGRKLNGRYAVYKVALDGTRQAELVASNDRVDVDRLLRLGRKGRVIGVSWITDKREVRYFDKELEGIARTLRVALPGSPAISFESASADEKLLLIEASSDTNPGKLYVYNKATRSLEPLLDVRPPMAATKLASVKPITYKAADGTTIPAYLTLPPDGRATGLPAIVMPHGGPSARDEWGFDWLAQYFAARGYAVLQPNYRGSAGYGDDWFVNNGFRSWDVAMADINAGAKWMIDQKIAAADKMAIVGWSYGGYAALQGSVVDPKLYKAIVAIAPVTDIEYLVTDTRNSQWNTRGIRRFVGRGPHIAAGSPRRHADKLTAPVLLISGDDDLNVDIRHARDMAKALRSAGKQVELVEYRDLDHQIPDTNARIDLLQRSDEFLRKSMGI